MQIKIASWIIVCLIFTGFLSSAQPKIILKLDDIGVKNGVCKASPVIELLLKRKIKFGLGVIANNLDSTALKVFDKYLTATDSKGSKLIEIWNHGLYHSNNNPPDGKTQEFKGTPYQFQLQHFNNADELVLKYLHVQMHTFGSPYNADDENTTKALAANGKYKVFLLSHNKEPFTNGIANLNNRVNMESATGAVNYDYFVSQYESLKNKYPEYMVLQGHPNQWDITRIAEFNKILDYLIELNSVFVLPYECYQSIR